MTVNTYLTEGLAEGPGEGPGNMGPGAAGEEDFSSRMAHIVQICGGVTTLARRADVSVAVVRKWKSGQSEPTVTRLVNLARAAGVSVAWLATGYGCPEPPETDENAHPALRREAVETAIALAERWRRKHPDFEPDPDHLARIIRVMAEEIQERGADHADTVVERLLAVIWPSEL